MPAVQETVDRVRMIDVDQYKHGFETAIPVDKAPKGLSEEVIRVNGSFVNVLPGVFCPMELSTYFRINERNTGQFERTLIIADKGAYVSYLEGCTAPRRDENQSHAAVVELVALEDVEIKYSSVQKSPEVEVSLTTRDQGFGRVSAEKCRSLRRRDIQMRNRTIIRDMADRPDTVSIRPSPEISAFAPRALPHSSIRPTRYGQGANDTPVRPAFRNTAELKINIEGQPILLRFFLDGLATGVPPRSSGSVPDINSLLSITLEKIADRIRRSAGGGGSSISNSLLASGDMGAEKDSGVVSLGRTLLRVGPLELNLLDRTAKRGNRLIDLRPREFRLLRYMMERSDKLLTRAALLRDVWNYKFVPQTNLVDVHMGRLRRKVDGPGEAPMIRSVRGAGFVLNAMPLSISRRDRPEAGLSQFNR